MTDTLDLPQHAFVCGACRRIVGQMPGACDDGSHVDQWGPQTAPTLSFADFQAYMTAVSLAVHPMPDDQEVWSYLEAHIGTEATNREAIDAAIRAVGRRDERT